MADHTAKAAHNVSVPADTDAELVGESLVEEVSIDGMCGVY